MASSFEKGDISSLSTKPATPSYEGGDLERKQDADLVIAFMDHSRRPAKH